MQISITNGTLTSLQETLSPASGFSLPSSISVTGATSSYDSTTGILTLTSPTSAMSVTATGEQIQSDKVFIGSLPLSKAYFGASEISKIYYGQMLLYEAQTIVIDPVLANNSWETIKQVCQAGEAGDYWALGDTKDISVTISGTATNIPHAIVDMTADRYEYASDSTKHSNVVFQAVPTIGDHMFNSSSNTSPNSDTAYNGWDYSQLRAKLQTGGAIFNSYDSTFTALLEQVKTMAAYSGKTNTLVYSNDLLFVPAAREVKANYTSVQSCEVNSEQTQYGYYYDNGNDGNANRIKYPYNSQSATYWWLRSPYADDTYHVRYVRNGGNMLNYNANYDRGVAPCFAW